MNNVELQGEGENKEHIRFELGGKKQKTVLLLLSTSTHLRHVAAAVYGVLRPALLQVQAAPVQVHLDSCELSRETVGDRHGGRQVDLNWSQHKDFITDHEYFTVQLLSFRRFQPDGMKQMRRQTFYCVWFISIYMFFFLFELFVIYLHFYIKDIFKEIK